MKTKISAKEYWRIRFDEYPQNDAEKLAVAMMQEYAEQSNQVTIEKQYKTKIRFVKKTNPQDTYYLIECFVDGKWGLIHGTLTFSYAETKAKFEELKRNKKDLEEKIEILEEYETKN